MRVSRTFLLCFGVALALVFLLQLQMPQRFSWNPTFSSRDKNPFGCLVFDSLMSQTMSSGYMVTRKTLYQLARERRPQSVLIVGENVELNRLDLTSVLQIARRGGRVLIAGQLWTADADSLLTDSFGMTTAFSSSSFYIQGLKEQILGHDATLYDTLTWRSSAYPYGEKNYVTYGMLVSQNITVTNARAVSDLVTNRLVIEDSPGNEESDTTGEQSIGDTLVQETGNAVNPVAAPVRRVDTTVIAAERPLGRGKIIMVSCPLLLTNYGILDPHTTGMVYRLMNTLDGLPVVRTTAYLESPAEEQATDSPLRYVLSQRPLRWALWLTLGLLLLFMVFTARRRERPLPVETVPENHSLEFIKLVGTLYYQQHDRDDLVNKKHTLMAETLREQLFIDIDDAAEDDHNFTVLSSQTGQSYEHIATLMHTLRQVRRHEIDVSTALMRQLIDQMNALIHRI